MKNDKLLKLCRTALQDKTLDEKNFKAFVRDYDKYQKDELTFRELIEGVKEPQGVLKEAMRAYYSESSYNRVFKGR